MLGNGIWATHPALIRSRLELLVAGATPVPQNEAFGVAVLQPGMTGVSLWC